MNTQIDQNNFDNLPVNNGVNNQTNNPSAVKINLLMAFALVFLISAIVFGLAGYLLGKQSVDSVTTNNPTQQSVSNTTTPSATPNIEKGTVLPDGWEYQSNGECGVKFAIPPRVAPYVDAENRFWDFPRGASYPNLLSKIWAGRDEYKQANAMYVTTYDSSGAIPQAVIVSCIVNNGRFNSYDEVISSLEAGFNMYNTVGEKGIGAMNYSIKDTSYVQRWGKNVIDITVSEDGVDVPYTMFMSPEFVYEIRVFGTSQDTVIKNTAKQIFDNLVL